MFYEPATTAPAAGVVGDVTWLQRRLARVWQLDPIASRLDAETLQGIRGAWGASPDLAPAAQKSRLLLSLAAVKRPVSVEVLDEGASLVVDLLRDHASTEDGPLIRTATGLLGRLCQPFCDPSSLRTQPIEEHAESLLDQVRFAGDSGILCGKIRTFFVFLQAAADCESICEIGAQSALQAISPPQPAAATDTTPLRPTLAERPLLLSEVPLEAHFLGLSRSTWSLTAQRTGAHFSTTPAVAARLQAQVRRAPSVVSIF